MTRNPTLSIATFLLSTMLGLAVTPSLAADDYVTNAADIVKAADWKQMTTVTVEISEYQYDPNQLEFTADQPYRLVLKNKGEKDHYFTATDFFKAIATRKVQSVKDGEVKAPYVKDLEIRKNGGELELFFVPIKKGTYPLFCSVEDHKEQGLHGSIVIK